MELAYSWLSKYLPTPVDIDSLSNILTSIGLEVESVEKVEAIKGSLEGLVVGEVMTCERHPDADKLSVTTVNVGGDNLLPIVCGAPNVAAGQKVIVATVGTTVYPLEGDSFLIKKAKIRGLASEGMICAEDEIGLGKSHDGILILPTDVVVGTPAAAYFNIPEPDYVISVGLTPNRSDAMSHIGSARDVCAYLTHHNTENKVFNITMPEVALPARTATLPIQVKIENEVACKQYLGITIADVTIQEAPEWIKANLKTIGVKSINNVVDITNYVLHEFGQPLHAFDYDKIANHEVIVKNMPLDTPFIALDGTEKKLTATDLMICDAEQPMCIAGVYGGKNSGVTSATQNIFLESAYFDPKTIRRTSMHHQLRTDAATHFEKGVDVEMIKPALLRAAALIVEYGKGKIASDIIELTPTPIPQTVITCKYQYIRQLAGKEYSNETITTILVALGFIIKDIDTETFEATVPYNKVDVKQGADLVEEVLRIDGLDNIQMNDNISMSLNTRPAPVARKWREKLATHLTAAGFQELVTNSITNSKYYPDNQHLVTMLNSLSVELDVLRPSLLESGLEVLAYNINRKQADLLVYENGNVYHAAELGKYSQSSKLGIWITGNVVPQQWEQKAKPADIYYTKGVIERILAISGINKFQIFVDKDTIEWRRGKFVLASATKLSKDKLKQFDIKQDVYYAEVDIKNFVDAAETNKIKYAELPKYPSMKRDLALIVDKNINFDQVQKIANSQKIDALKSFELFDIFESEKLGLDKKSLAVSFTFQLKDRTLTDEEVDQMMTTFSNKFKSELAANIRD